MDGPLLDELPSTLAQKTGLRNMMIVEIEKCTVVGLKVDRPFGPFALNLTRRKEFKMTLFLHFGPVDLFDFLSSDNLVEVDSNRDDNLARLDEEMTEVEIPFEDRCLL